MTDTQLREKVKQLERRVNAIERRTRSDEGSTIVSSPSSTRNGLKMLSGLWNKKPRTPKDLERVRKRVFQETAGALKHVIKKDVVSWQRKARKEWDR